MHLFIALGLLIVYGIVDATFYNPRSQTFNQLMERRQRSIPIPYSYGYHYNPIEPSINVLDSLSEGLDSRINTYKPIYENVKMSTHDVNSIPRTHSYQPKNSLYDSEYISVQDVPSLFPEEESVDYKYLKYLGSPLNKFLTQPPTTESDIAINLVAIKKTSVFGYGFPTYKSPYSPEYVWNFGSKIPNTILKDSQSAETIVKLLPETLDQEPTITTTNNPIDVLFEKLLEENQNEVNNSVEDKLNYEITQEIPTEAESNPISSEEFPTMDQSNILVLVENQTKDESNPLELEENPTKDESSFITTEETQTEDDSNSLILEENPIKDESSFITIEEFPTVDESNSLILEENPTEDESSFITTEETQTEDESNSITTEKDQTGNDESNYIITEENQTEDDESKSMTSQETTTAFKPNYLSNKYRYLESDEYIQTKIKDLMESYKKLFKQNIESEFRTVENIPIKFIK